MLRLSILLLSMIIMTQAQNVKYPETTGKGGPARSTYRYSSSSSRVYTSSYSTGYRTYGGVAVGGPTIIVGGAYVAPPMIVGAPVMGLHAPVYGYGIGSSLFFFFCFPCIAILICFIICQASGKNVEVYDNNYA